MEMELHEHVLPQILLNLLSGRDVVRWVPSPTHLWNAPHLTTENSFCNGLLFPSFSLSLLLSLFLFLLLMLSPFPPLPPWPWPAASATHWRFPAALPHSVTSLHRISTSSAAYNICFLLPCPHLLTFIIFVFSSHSKCDFVSHLPAYEDG